MQPLARGGLTDAQVTDLIQAGNLTVTGGLDLLNADLTLREDISGDIEGGTVTRGLYNTIHTACSLRITRELLWGVDLVRPHLTLSDGLRTARFNVGVFALTTPQRSVGATPETFDVSGFDRLLLLNRQIGADYSVPAGQSYRTALLNAFAAAGLTGALIEGAAADSTLPAARSWPLVADRAADPDQTDTPVTYLRVINDLLRAISFRSVWADENGLFRCQAYVLPAGRAPEFTFDADSGVTILGEDRTVIEDVWATPNRWVFRQTNRATGAPVATEGDGLYTVVNQTDGITSINSRGLTWTSVVDYEAASQAKLVDLGNRRVQSDRASTVRYEVTVGPFPAALHADIYTYRDLAAGISRKVQQIGYTMDLTGGDTAMTWEIA